VAATFFLPGRADSRRYGKKVSMTVHLPANANLEHLRRQAKDLLKGLKAGETLALERAKPYLPRLSGDTGAASPGGFKLAEAQLIIGREYGFASWPKLQRTLVARKPTREEGIGEELLAQVKLAFRSADVDQIKALLVQHPGLVARINDPLFAFGSRAISVVRRNRELVDLLLAHGADLNLKSDWWAGGFGILEGADPETAAYLIQRGAVVDVHAAASLGMLDRLRQLVAADPALVNARGGDGQRPLHLARTPEIIDFLLDQGADIDARDLDHGSTPAQYAVKEPEKCRRLLRRGARPDIFMAIMLGDVALVEKVLTANPDCLQSRIGQGEFVAPGSEGGHIYLYVIGGHTRPLHLAAELGHQAIVALLLQHSTLSERLLLACWQAAGDTVRDLLGAYPDMVHSLSAQDQRVICDAARDNRVEAVRLMLQAGFDVNTRGYEDATPLDRAAIMGRLAMVDLLLDHHASVDVTNQFGGAPLGACIWGSVNFRNRTGDYPACAERLIAAGAKLPEQAGGSPAVVEVLRRHGVLGTSPAR
jgi:ankyrin repeat protein